MKKLLTVLVLAAVVAGCSKAKVYTDGLRFCEGVTFYGDTLLVSNFGTDELNPLNTEGKGYIMALTDTVSRVFIPADGNLSGPKGMEIVGGRLYIADVGKVVVYDLSDREAAPQVVMFPEADIYVNDMLYEAVPLNKDAVIVVDQGDGKVNYVEVKDGEIFMADSTCPDHLCVSQGAMSPETYEKRPMLNWIICLPNLVSVELRIEQE